MAGITSKFSVMGALALLAVGVWADEFTDQEEKPWMEQVESVAQQGRSF